jgi:hypothetical protein
MTTGVPLAAEDGPRLGARVRELRHRRDVLPRLHGKSATRAGAARCTPRRVAWCMLRVATAGVACMLRVATAGAAGDACAALCKLPLLCFAAAARPRPRVLTRPSVARRTSLQTARRPPPRCNGIFRNRRTGGSGVAPGRAGMAPGRRWHGTGPRWRPDGSVRCGTCPRCRCSSSSTTPPRAYARRAA